MSQTQAAPSATADAGGHTLGVDASAGTAGGDNTSNDSIGTVQSGAPNGSAAATADGTTVTAPVVAGGGGGNDASGSTGTVQVGGGNGATGSTGAVQTSSAGSDTRSLAGSSGGTSSPAGLQGSAGGAAPSTGAVPVKPTAGTGGLNTPPDASTSADPGTTLPFTGQSLGRWLVLGMALLLGGAGLRRRSAA